MVRFLKSRFRQFVRDENGLVMTEFLILLPLLIWAFMALVVYWDTFRTINEAQKASYAISDLMSRQSDVDTNFLRGMETMFDYLLDHTDGIEMRITSIEWDEDADNYFVLFSYSPSGRMRGLDNNEINAAKFRSKIPVLADHESVIVVETRVAYSSLFRVPQDKSYTSIAGHEIFTLLKLGVSDQTFSNLIVTRPRYFRRVCLISTPCPERFSPHAQRPPAENDLPPNPIQG